MLKKLSALICGLLTAVSVYAAPVNIVSAENFYGELASEIGGKNVIVQSIINNPDADPHLFATSPSANRALSQAQIIIYNGADYDPWMEQMLKSIDPKKVIIIINVASLVGVKSGANPHIWYKPDTFPRLAKLLATSISQLNPQAKPQTDANLKIFLNANQKVDQAIAQVKAKYFATAVTATEPVYGYMAEAMGLKMRGLDFQWKVMNDSEPTPKMVADYQSLLNRKQVKLLFYNNQVNGSLTQNMQDLARSNGIAVVGVSETMPNSVTVNAWLLKQVIATSQALGKSK